jgi:cytochrome c556
MKKLLLLVLATITLCATTLVSLAEDEAPFQNEIEARHSFMHILRFNLGILGAMAKGEMPYDAAHASAAANNLLVASKMSNSAMWPAGSDMSAADLEGVTWAKPDIWASMPSFDEKGRALTDALEAMAAAAGDGLGALRSNMGAVGDGCKGCHESFRASQD